MSTLALVIIIVLVLAFLGSFPRWGHSAGWGYQPFGFIGAILVVILILALVGYL